MTAVNAFQNERIAWLMTDAAGYDRDGTVLSFYQKAYALPSCRAAIGVRGSSILPPLLASALSQRFHSFDSLTDGVSAYLRRSYTKEIAPHLGINADFECVIAGWSESADRPKLFFLTKVAGSRFEPFKLYEEPGAIIAPMPSVDVMRAAGMREDITSYNFDPSRDAIPLMEAQRRSKGVIKNSASHNEIAPVGGYLLLTEITRNGVHQQVIHRWRDRIGSPIDLAA
jgi:hypothetical protein